MENNTFEYVVPCHFGMEAVLKREIMALGYEIVNVADGRVTFRGDEKAIARANIFLRTAERVLLCVGRFKQGILMNFLRQRRRFHGEIISPGQRKILGQKGFNSQESVIQQFGHSVNCEEGNC